MPSSLSVRARHYATGEPVHLTSRGDRISHLGPADGSPVDVAAGWVAPALFDLQINGAAGHSFTSLQLTVEQVRAVMSLCRQHGLSGLCPTLITSSQETLLHALRILRQAWETDPRLDRALPALHLEGPYISPEDGPRGAHPRVHVRPPSWDEFCRLQEAADGRIRLLTLAPEVEGALAFIERLTAAGVVVALGHTAARAVQVRAAIAAGARLSTHLGNGSHALLPRHDNYLWEQLAADELWASVISDGHHLPPALLRCILRVKTPARLVLTCDASPLAGLPPGRYREWGADVDVLPGGRVGLAGTPYLAGAGVFTDACVAHAVTVGGLSLAEALDLAGARPRLLLGLEPRPLQQGAPADLVLFDWQPGDDFCVRATIIAGEWEGSMNHVGDPDDGPRIGAGQQPKRAPSGSGSP
jgi:N-acetylglucosamine-6-phosphate deacetylase